MSDRRRQFVLGAGLVVTLALVWFAPKDDGDALVTPSKNTNHTVRAATQAATTAADDLPARLHAPQRHAALLAGASQNLFGSRSWVVPPPPPPPEPPPPPPPPPSAPPLPFTYLGRYAEGDVQVVILAHGNRVFNAAAGDLLEKTYQVDRIEPNRVDFRYLPMDVTQSLVTGAAP